MLESIKSVEFWIIFGNVMCNVYVMSFVYSDWKLFANEYLLIEDDKFLLKLNLVAAICNLFGRMIWGVIYDYFRSYKYVMLTITILTCFFIITLPICINQTMAFIYICSLWFMNSATYTILPSAISSLNTGQI